MGSGVEELAGRFLRRHGDALLQVEPELAYLVTLTATSLKPVSRFEWEASPPEQAALSACGLRWALVGQVGSTWGVSRQTLFSLRADLLQRAVESADGEHLIATPERKRLEGQLFGYPACCVAAYVAGGSEGAGRAPDQSALLFHWPCPGCEATPALLRQYQRVAEAVVEALGGQAWW